MEIHPICSLPICNYYAIRNDRETSNDKKNINDTKNIFFFSEDALNAG